MKTKVETVEKKVEESGAPWQMEIDEFNANGCLINGD
jgi:hypothetical protein